MAIISSLLETDLYKLTMLQAMFHRLRGTTAKYEFVNRTNMAGRLPLSIIAEDLSKEIDHLCTLSFTKDEIDYLKSLDLFAKDFLEYLESFRLNRTLINVFTDNELLRIETETSEILDVSLFEIYVLSLVNELYFKKANPSHDMSEGRAIRANLLVELALNEPALSSKKTDFEFFDFGLRRRFSKEWHDEVVFLLRSHEESRKYFKGTSNVYLAKKYGLPAIGTMAHEYLQAYQQVTGVAIADFQKTALKDWILEYNGKLGIALTDIVGMDAFIVDFDYELATRYSGIRHDSGDPVDWANKAIAMYSNLGIDPLTKRLVFSDGLTLTKAISLFNEFGDKAMTGFGIGTSLTNSVGVTPLNVVMKITECNGRPVAKLSDSKGKTLCKDKSYVELLATTFNKKEY